MGNLKSLDKTRKEINFEEVERSLLYFATSIFGKNTEKEILWDLAKNCISQLGFEDCVVYLVDDSTQKLVQIAAYGPKNPKDFHLYQPIEITVGEGITGSVAKTGLPEIVGDTSNDDRYIIDDINRYSEIAVPIIYQQNVLGVIDSEHREKHFFTQQHLRILTSVASLCANKIIRARVEEEMKENQQKLHVLERQLADLKLLAIRSQMNPHFIFNSLNAIQHFITINDKKSALGYLSNFSKFIRIILKNSDSDLVYLHEEQKMLYHYLELQLLRYEGKFTYTINHEPLLNSEKKIPPSIIQPFVEICLTYGVLPASEFGEISVTFESWDHKVVCKIFDNGIKRFSPWSKNITADANQNILTEYNPLFQRVKLLNKSKKMRVRITVDDDFVVATGQTGTLVAIEFK